MLEGVSQDSRDIHRKRRPVEGDLRVLFVADWVQWITGTLAQSIARFNPWVEATIISAGIAERIFGARPELWDNFDLVHFTCSYASRRWLPVLRDRIPCVTSHHHVSDWDAMKHNLEGDAIVVASRQWEEDLQQRGVPAGRIVRIPYGVDAERFKPPSAAERTIRRRQLGIPPENIVVGFFGKKSSDEFNRKGTDIFAKAIVEVHGRVPQLTALIVGPGWEEFVQTLQAAGLHTVYRPFIRGNTELARTYDALDFYWVTARVEGGPVPLLEAMSSGVCCVTTPVGLARDIVLDGRNAVLVPMNDSTAVAANTLRMAGDQGLRSAMGTAARQTILESMDLPVVYRRIPELYRVAIGNFVQRRGCPVHCALPDDIVPPTQPPEFTSMPLHGFTPAMRSEIRRLETLSWGEALIIQGQRDEGLRLILGQCLRAPAHSQPWRVLLRNTLPRTLVSRLVRLRRQGLPAAS